MRRRTFLLSLGAWSLAACGRGNDRAPAPTPLPTATRPVATTAPAPTATSSPVPSATPTATDPRIEPIGFPIDPAARLGIVTGVPGNRAIRWGEGPTAIDYSRDDQPSDDPDRANRCGWNARLHRVRGQPRSTVHPAGHARGRDDGWHGPLLINTSPTRSMSTCQPEPIPGQPRPRPRGPWSPSRSRGGQGVFRPDRERRYRTIFVSLRHRRDSRGGPAGGLARRHGTGDDFVARSRRSATVRVATPVARCGGAAGEVIARAAIALQRGPPPLRGPAGRVAQRLCPTTEPLR